MPLKEEITMLEESIAIIKSKMAHAQNKREYLLLKDQLHTTRYELALAQYENEHTTAATDA